MPTARRKVCRPGQGDLLQPDFVVRNQADNSSGTVWFALTQLNPSEAVSGSGVVFVVTFRGRKAGASSPLTFAYQKLASRTGDLIPASVEDGEIRVVSAEQAPPTPTTAPTLPPPTTVPPTAPPPTSAPTVAPTSTPVPQPTAAATTTKAPPAAAETAVEPTASVPTVAPPAISAPATAVAADGGECGLVAAAYGNDSAGGSCTGRDRASSACVANCYPGSGSGGQILDMADRLWLSVCGGLCRCGHRNEGQAQQTAVGVI